MDDRNQTSAWQLLATHEHELAKIAGAVARTSGLDPDDALDLVHSFALERLTAVVDRAPIDPARRGAYIRSSFRNFVRDAIRRQRREEDALACLRAEVGVDLRDEAHERESVVSSAQVEQALAAIPSELATAARAYLGVDGAAASIREIAQRGGLSRHAARRAVIDGLLAAGVALGQSGALTPMQSAAVRAVLSQGVAIEVAAARLHLTTAQVRRALRDARSLVARSL